MEIGNVLHPVLVREMVTGWIKEDTADFDYAGLAVGNTPTRAFVFCKSKGVLAGTPFVDAIFGELGCSVTWTVEEGSLIADGRTMVCKPEGPARNLLLAERVVLNCLSRASGVATTTRRLRDTLGEWTGHLAATRKTTPGFRMVEKYGVMVGNGCTHRNNLSEMVMLKDNHLALAGSVSCAVAKVRKVTGFSRKVEVECSGLEQALQAAQAGCDVVMLDNLTPEEVHKTAAEVKKLRPNVLVEASGGIHEATIRSYAGPNVDVISTSSLVHGYSVLDFSMDVSESVI